MLDGSVPDRAVSESPAIRPPRVAIVASHVIQYQAPFFRLLAREIDADFTVLYCSRHGAEAYHDVDMGTTLRWDVDLLSGYRYRFLRNLGVGRGYTRLVNPGIVSALRGGRYDVVILFLGWGTVTSLMAIATCDGSAVPFLLYGDSSFLPPEDTPSRRLRARALKEMFRRARGFLVSGHLNAEYYKHYGADEARFSFVPWAIDNDRFSAASAFASGEREAMRARFGIRPDQMAIVFSGKLIRRKGPMTLLRAVEGDLRGRVTVMFLGQGELRKPLEAFAKTQGIQVHFPGFVNQTELPKHYAMADVFVLPSFDDPRATVINEAMACGLPVVVSNRCGPIGDIAKDGDNALVFRAGDEATLAAHLRHLAEQPALRQRMGRRSREIIAGWNYQRGVEGVRDALGKCLHLTD